MMFFSQSQYEEFWQFSEIQIRIEKLPKRENSICIVRFLGESNVWQYFGTS